MKPQLLCTFTHMDRLTSCISMIYTTYNSAGVANMECYFYVSSPDNVICIYTTNPTHRRLKDTISINRKKKTNTLYSINALNGLIRHLNNGILDKSYRINWYDYPNSLLLASGDFGYKAIEIKRMTQ